MPIDVLHLVSHYRPESYGGVESYVYNLSLKLEGNENVNNEILTTTGNLRNEILKNQEKVYRSYQLFSIRDAGVSPSLLYKIFRINPDIIHLHIPFHGGALSALTAKKVLSIPLITTIHNYSVGISIINDLYISFVENTVINGSDIIVGTTDDYLKGYDVFDCNMHKIKTVPCGVNINKFKPVEQTNRSIKEDYNIADDSQVVSTVGSLGAGRYYKRVDWLIKAFDQVMNKVNDVVLLIVGEGEKKKELKQLAKDIGIEHSTIFTGFVEGDELPKIYDISDLFVLPSQHPESFGIVLLEAMACETRVITSDIPGPSSVAQSCGGDVFEPGDLNSLANKIIENINKDGSGKIRSCVVKNYSWEIVAQEWNKIYNQLYKF